MLYWCYLLSSNALSSRSLNATSLPVISVEAAVYCGCVKRLEFCVWTRIFCLKLLWLSGAHLHIGYEMKDEVLGRQGISQKDVGEVCEQLRSDAWHFAQRWRNNWKVKKTTTNKQNETNHSNRFRWRVQMRWLRMLCKLQTGLVRVRQYLNYGMLLILIIYVREKKRVIELFFAAAASWC